MSRASRAIIMAAGKGERMHPVTKHTPKPLIRIKGIRMIDTIIQGLEKNGIQEIYIVVGYLKEHFLSLAKEYPQITLIENPYYETCNNISSLYVAREYIENAIILDGDQMIYDPSILNPEFDLSGYRCIWTDSNTREWLLTCNECDIISSCNSHGGPGGWQLFSISYWNSEDGKKLKQHLEIEFEEKQNRQIFWDNIPLFCYPQDYKLKMYPMSASAVREFDNLEELIQADGAYRTYKEC